MTKNEMLATPAIGLNGGWHGRHRGASRVVNSLGNGYGNKDENRGVEVNIGNTVEV